MVRHYNSGSFIFLSRHGQDTLHDQQKFHDLTRMTLLHPCYDLGLTASACFLFSYSSLESYQDEDWREKSAIEKRTDLVVWESGIDRWPNANVEAHKGARFLHLMWQSLIIMLQSFIVLSVVNYQELEQPARPLSCLAPHLGISFPLLLCLVNELQRLG